MTFFFINSKPLWRHDFYYTIFTFFKKLLLQSENKIKEHILIILLDYTNITKPFEITLNSKHLTKKLKAKEAQKRKKNKIQKNEHQVLPKEYVKNP